VVLIGGKSGWWSHGVDREAMKCGDGNLSSTGRRWEHRQEDFGAAMDVVRSGGDLGAFYRPGGSGRWQDGRSDRRWQVDLHCFSFKEGRHRASAPICRGGEEAALLLSSSRRTGLAWRTTAVADRLEAAATL
jgi:hypothetical protein